MKTTERLIGSAVVRGGGVNVYDEKGLAMFVLPGGKNFSVYGYTSRTVTILREKTLYTYNNKGTNIGVRGL